MAHFIAVGIALILAAAFVGNVAGTIHAEYQIRKGKQ